MGFRSGEFAGQSSTVTPWSLNQVLVPLAVWAGAKSCWKMKSASLKSWSAEGSMKCSKIPVYGCVDCGLQKTQWTNTMAAQIITDCGNFTLDFKQHGFCASPLFLQTLGPCFQMKCKIYFHLKRGLWTTDFFFSTAQVRRF